ncbi:MAG: asparagine synthase C-terminal domain-containing protein [Actinobacteria bacterium]|nr:asparagine synthase C-terminal domain-containing protein [Actinomycetota bacterium]
MDDRGLLISSEVRPLLRPGDAVSREGLARFLHLGSLPAASSPFEGVSAVPPNAWLAFEGTSLVDQGLVEPALEVARGSGVGVADALRESVALHVRSDVPAALLLSSGIDSSALAWAGREAGQTLHCLTVDLGGGREEAAEAAGTAARFGHTHEMVRSVPDGEDVNAFFRAMQRPSIDGLNSFVVSRAVREAGFKVALSGLGGDEATGGYSHFAHLRRLKALARVDQLPGLSGAVALAVRAGRGRMPAKARELLGRDGPRDAWELSLLQRRVWEPTQVRRALGLPADANLVQDVPAGRGRADAAGLTAAEYRTYLQSTLLPDADAFSMAFSVELRVPLVDAPFLASAVGAGGAAGLGKAGFAGALGDERLAALACAPKQGFSLPMDDWMRTGILRDRVRAAAAPDAPVWQHLDREVGTAALDAWTRRAAPWSHAWALVALDSWLRSLP